MSIERSIGQPSQLEIDREKLRHLTARALIEDNASPLAEENRRKWKEKRRAGRLKGKKKCLDSRLVTEEDITVRSIAGADETSPGIIGDPDIEAWEFLSHKGEGLRGCGGLGAKETLKTPAQAGLERFISQIAHHDFLIQSLLSAEGIAEISGKPVLAAVQDHLDLSVYPLSYFYTKNGRVKYESPIRLKDIADGQYNPEKLYANGIPTVSESELPDVLIEMLEADRQKAQEIRNKYPNLREMQEVQNPLVVFLTTDIRPLSSKYPGIAGVPGTILKIHLPRKKIEGVSELDEKAIQVGVEQLEYPVKHSVQNHKVPNGSFRDSRLIVTETGDLRSSENLFNASRNEKWMQDFIAQGNVRLILLQSAGGITHQEAFKELTFDPQAA